MFHPIGSHPPAVYWRRRLALFGALLVLIVITAWELRPGGGGNSAAGTVRSPSSSANPVSPHPTGAAPTTKHPSTPVKPSTSTTPAPRACNSAALKVTALVDKPGYRVGEQPVVRLKVTNTGPVPCVQDLADSQIELRVYNGESRVWGSHDCTIQPGVADRTLAAKQPVLVSIVWSGLSSQPKCAGTRQRVGAGTYTLYALLSGREGAAAQFSIS